MKPTILVVDDEADIRGLLRVLLQRAGYTVAEAATGSDVRAAVAEHKPDLVLLDVMLPDLDGYDVCRLLKGDPASRHIPILMQTGLRGRTEELRAMGAGADGFLSKPVVRAELLANVEAHLSGASRDQGWVHRHHPTADPPSRGGAAAEGDMLLAAPHADGATLDRETATLRHDLDAVLQSVRGSMDFLVQRLGGTLESECARVLFQVRADAHRARQLLARLDDR